MTRLIEQNREALNELCRKFGVFRLDVFGSAATDRFSESASDLDFLVEFQRGAMDADDQYFGLLFELQSLFGRSVDLVCASAMTNPYFVRSVNQSRKLLYAA